MVTNKKNEVEFVYNEEMEKRFGEGSNGLDPIKYKYGYKTFANPRALQSFGQG